MAIGNLAPWRWGSLRSFDDDRTFDTFRTEMDSLHRSIDRLFDLPKTKEAQERIKQIPVKAT